MRGSERKQASMLTTLSPEKVVPKKHPLRKVKELADAALRELSPLFDEMYSSVGRPSTPPERRVGHTQRTPLQGQRFETIEEAQTYLDRWDANWGDTRIHGTTKPGHTQRTPLQGQRFCCRARSLMVA